MTPDEGFRMLDDDASWPVQLTRRAVPSRPSLAPLALRVAVVALLVTLSGGVIAGAIGLRSARDGRVEPIAVPSVCASSAPTPTVDPTPSAQLRAAQQVSVQLASAAVALDAAGHLQGDRGFVGVTVDPTTSVVQLTWRGPLPADVQRAVDAVDPSVTVRVDTSAAYSHLEMLAAQQRLAAQRDTLRSSIGSFTTDEDPHGAGILVDLGRRPDDDAAPGVRDRLARAAGLPVTLVARPLIPTEGQVPSASCASR